jgi:single-stranded-DNA-specific exonuclease
MDWQLPPQLEIPAEFLSAVQTCLPTVNGRYAARLLWQRGMRDRSQLAGYLNSDRYQPSSPFEFGLEMELAVGRLQQAVENGDRVAIWGDFDADGVTSTSVLMDGLGQFLGNRLSYYIPNRMTESHGLNMAGIDRFAAAGINLIITCDTGSTNIQEIAYANSLGIDTIVTDHHTLPPDRPPVVAIINPRYLAKSHPLFHLSGVAVAYKLVEALYVRLPEIPQQPLDYLLDLVAIGLIADLVQLTGDCRYLAQVGLKRLSMQTKTDIDGFRPGVHRLLELCKKTGDRPFDVSFGVAPRINAISRIHGDASFGVELLTSGDRDRTLELAAETELANSRRKELQKKVGDLVERKLETIDLSTTSVIVLSDSDWSPGVLGLVAGKIAQDYGKPTILLSTERGDNIARGSARSTNNIDLYQLVNSQAHLLNSFGGHPYAAGMSIKVENIPLFTEAIGQQLRSTLGQLPPPSMATDLQITVAELTDRQGQGLFDELRSLEPYGMGNPVPKLLIKNCHFDNIRNKNIKDFKGGNIQYIRTTFELRDRTTERTFPGMWWGHYAHEIPQVACDAIVELDFNSFNKRCEVRLIEVRPTTVDIRASNQSSYRLEIVDLRHHETAIDRSDIESIIWVRECPIDWNQMQSYCLQAIDTERKLALAYQQVNTPPAEELFDRSIGIAKYLARTHQSIDRDLLSTKLTIGDRTLQLYLIALKELGFTITDREGNITIAASDNLDKIDRDLSMLPAVRRYLAAIAEERFRQNYFLEVPIYTIESMVLECV